MNLYFNSTRFPAIVTLKIESVGDSDAAVVTAEPGEENAVTNHKGKVGYLDIQVDSGKELRIDANTVASFVAVRSAQ